MREPLRANREELVLFVTGHHDFSVNYHVQGVYNYHLWAELDIEPVNKIWGNYLLRKAKEPGSAREMNSEHICPQIKMSYKPS